MKSSVASKYSTSRCFIIEQAMVIVHVPKDIISYW